MCFTIAMAWTIVMPNGRTRSAGRYITLPDIGVGACGRNTVTQLFSSVSSRYPICQPPSMLTSAGFTLSALSTCASPSAMLFTSWYCGRPPNREFSQLTRSRPVPSEDRGLNDKMRHLLRYYDSGNVHLRLSYNSDFRLFLCGQKDGIWRALRELRPLSF
jgi:hypothetical protein